MIRKLAAIAILAAGSATAQYATLTNVADLVSLADENATNTMARMVPPGPCHAAWDLGEVTFLDGFDTNFLALLSPRTGPGGVPLYPIRIVEQTNAARDRVYFNADGVPAYTSAPPPPHTPAPIATRHSRSLSRREL